MLERRKKLAKIWVAYRWRNPDEPITNYYPRFIDTKFNFHVLVILIGLFVYSILAKDFGLIPWIGFYLLFFLTGGELNKTLDPKFEWLDNFIVIFILLTAYLTYITLGLPLVIVLFISLLFFIKYFKKYNYCYGLLNLIEKKGGILPFREDFLINQ